MSLGLLRHIDRGCVTTGTRTTKFTLVPEVALAASLDNRGPTARGPAYVLLVPSHSLSAIAQSGSRELALQSRKSGSRLGGSCSAILWAAFTVPSLARTSP